MFALVLIYFLYDFFFCRSLFHLYFFVWTLRVYLYTFLFWLCIFFLLFYSVFFMFSITFQELHIFFSDALLFDILPFYFLFISFSFLLRSYFLPPCIEFNITFFSISFFNCFCVVSSTLIITLYSFFIYRFCYLCRTFFSHHAHIFNPSASLTNISKQIITDRPFLIHPFIIVLIWFHLFYFIFCLLHSMHIPFHLCFLGVIL